MQWQNFQYTTIIVTVTFIMQALAVTLLGNAAEFP